MCSQGSVSTVTTPSCVGQRSRARSRIEILALRLLSCGPLSKLATLSGPQFPCLLNGTSDNISQGGVVVVVVVVARMKRTIMYIKLTEQSSVKAVYCPHDHGALCLVVVISLLNWILSSMTAATLSPLYAARSPTSNSDSDAWELLSRPSLAGE